MTIKSNHFPQNKVLMNTINIFANWMNVSSGMKKIGFQQVLPVEVIKLAQQGDVDSFETIYKTYFSALLSQ